MNFDQNLDLLLKQEKIIKKKYKVIKLPYYHLYNNRDRLLELKQKQANGFIDSNKKLPDNFDLDFEIKDELTSTEYEEMKRLGSSGFVSWDKSECEILIGFLEKNGNTVGLIDSLVNEIETKNKEEIAEYLNAFWARAKDLPDGLRLLRNIEKKNKAQQQKELSQMLINLKIKKSQADSWDKVNVVYPTNANRHSEFSNEEDNFLVWLCYTYEYGSWEKIMKEIRLSDDFMFNYYLKSRNSSEIAKRIDYLVKVLQREFSEEPEVQRFLTTMNTNPGEAKLKMDIDIEHDDHSEQQIQRKVKAADSRVEMDLD